MKSYEETMEILEAFDLTGSLRSAGELAGCSHPLTVPVRTCRAPRSSSPPSTPGFPWRDVQIVAHHADPFTTTVYEGRRQNDDRHAAYAVVAFVISGCPG